MSKGRAVAAALTAWLQRGPLAGVDELLDDDSVLRCGLSGVGFTFSGGGEALFASARAKE